MTPHPQHPSLCFLNLGKVQASDPPGQILFVRSRGAGPGDPQRGRACLCRGLCRLTSPDGKGPAEPVVAERVLMEEFLRAIQTPVVRSALSRALETSKLPAATGS